MSDLEAYFDCLMLREVEQFRETATKPAARDATEVAQRENPPLPIATGQSSTAIIPMAINNNIPIPLFVDGADEKTIKQPPPPSAQQPKSITVLLTEDEAANGFQGIPVPLLALPSTTDRHRRANCARQQRVHRLAHKLDLFPGGPRWVRGGRAYMQPAVPRTGVRAGNGGVEYNQFMWDDANNSAKVVLRMPGGWRRDLVRDRPAFLGVVLVDGFLWPRFERSLPRRVAVDWEEQGFVEFNEVRYTTPFVPREPKPVKVEDEEDNVLIKLEED